MAFVGSATICRKIACTLFWLIIFTNPSQAQVRGRIANEGFRDSPIYGSLFFAGPANPSSLPLYSRHPKDIRSLQWTAKGIRQTLTLMRNIGLNTFFLSYWGHDGETDKWSPTLMFSRRRWPEDTGTSKYSDLEQVTEVRSFFGVAEQNRLFVCPLIEVSPANRFWNDFPTNLDNLVSRCSWLLANMGNQPNWLKLYDVNGVSRVAIRLIETIHDRPIDPDEFAAGFVRASDAIFRKTGYRVGFIIDPKSLPGYGSEYGPTVPAMLACSAVLAVAPYNICNQGTARPESGVQITEADRLTHARDLLAKWQQPGVPLVVPIMPGYDARYVFPDAGVFGFNDNWRHRERELAIAFGTAGINIDCWNGWSEGYGIPPTLEAGDTDLRWAKGCVEALKLKFKKQKGILPSKEKKARSL